MEENKSIWDLRDDKLKEWWLIRDDLAEHVDQDGTINLEKVLSAFTEALNRLDGEIKNSKAE